MAWQILSHLTATDLIQCGKVNKTWYRLANDTFALWRPLYEEKFDKPLNHYKAKWATISQSQIENHEWKDLYRINHNWLSGHCTSTRLNINNMDLNISNNDINTERYIQYTHDILCFMNQEGTKVEIWKIKNTTSIHIGTLLDDQLFQPQQHVITCLKLIKHHNLKYTLIIGTNHTEILIWEFSITSDSDDDFKPILLCRKKNDLRHCEHQEKDAIIAIDMCDSIIGFCTESMKLEFYDILPITSQQQLRLIYHLQSNVHWSPIVLQLNKKKQSSLPSSLSLNQQHQWCALLFFGMQIGLNASSIGVQEMIISKNTLISSRHCSVFSQDQLFFTNTTTSGIDPSMTSMIFSEPFLMTSHSNNTIKQYRFDSNNNNQVSSTLKKKRKTIPIFNYPMFKPYLDIRVKSAI
ncbi:unnamed protein product [Cunninghamella blakesleeana]